MPREITAPCHRRYRNTFLNISTYKKFVIIHDDIILCKNQFNINEYVPIKIDICISKYERKRYMLLDQKHVSRGNASELNSKISCLSQKQCAGPSDRDLSYDMLSNRPSKFLYTALR